MGEIYNLLQQNGVVRVDELAGRFQVSEMTIRRDLEKMEREGRLIRCHGGAVQKMEITRDQGFDNRASLNLDAKMRLARTTISRKTRLFIWTPVPRCWSWRSCCPMCRG